MASYNVGYIIGSLAKASINRRLMTALMRVAPPGLQFTEISIGDLPLYSYDHDANYPEVALKLKSSIANADAVLFVTPEYNRGIPGALKNAIDWASRPFGTNSFAKKPTAVIGASPGKIGTAVAQQQLRSALAFCNSPQMTSPEAYIQYTKNMVDDEGVIADDSTREFLGKFMKEFHAFLDMVVPCLNQPRS